MNAVAESTSVADLLAVGTDTARVEFVREQGLADAAGLSWLLDRAGELVHAEPTAAAELIRVATDVAAAAGLDAITARARYLQARICAERGELATALDLIGQARDGWLRAGDQLGALRTDLGRMQILDDMGQHGEAIVVGEQLLASLPSDEAAAGLRTAALGNIGVAYSFVGAHDHALAAYSQAEEASLLSGPATAVAQHRANRGIELLALGRAREALGVLTSAAREFAAAGDQLWAAKCAGNVADAHRQLGAIVATLRVLEPARAELAELGATAEEARIQLALGKAYLAAGLLSEATTAATAAAETLAGAGMWHDAAFARFTMALAHIAAERFEPAAAELTAASELFDRVGDRQYQARALLARATLLAGAGDVATATDTANRAVTALDAGGWQIPLAWAQLQRFDLDPDPAVLEEAAALIDDLGLPQLDYALGLRTARRSRAVGDVEGAERILTDAVAVVDRLGAALPDPMLRAAFRADKLAAHDELVDLLVTRDGRGDAARALLISDSAKAKVLTDLLTGGTDRSEAHDDASRLRTDLSATFAAMSDADGPAHRRLLQSRAATLEEQLGALRLSAALTSAPRTAGPATADLPTSPTLAYHVVGADVIAFLAAEGQVTARRLPDAMTVVRRELVALVSQWNRFRIGTAFTRRNAPALVATALDSLRRLHDVLVAPLRDRLDDLGTDRLFVVAHRQLQQIPFHALHDGADPLLTRWTLTMAPTAATYRAAAAPERSGALVLGVPDAHAPAIAGEVKAIGATLPDARILLGDAATSARLRAELPGPALVHLACHGLYRRANPLFSGLRLADRWITSAEILELDLGGALVTLSACESGRPAHGTAEPVGLAWSFLAAGASGVIVSQWVVDDSTTAELMPDLYRGIAAGASPADALRAAQLEARERHPHPYHWAPFVHVARPAGGQPCAT